MPRTQQTATQAYDARRAEVAQLIKKLEAAVEAHDRRRSSQPGASSSWGWAGDLGYVATQLEEAVNFLSGTSN